MRTSYDMINRADMADTADRADMADRADRAGMAGRTDSRVIWLILITPLTQSLAHSTNYKEMLSHLKVADAIKYKLD